MKMTTLMAVMVMGLGVAATTYAAAPARGEGRAGRAAAAGQAGRRGAAAQEAGGAARGRGARGERIDKREANQQKRIEAGIAKGQITSDEAAKLQTLETNLQTMETSYKGDGKLSKDEAKQLREALNQASVQIWAQRHDTEGNQKPVGRLGKDVFAKDEVTAKMESGDMTKAEAKAFLQDFHKMTNLKRRLATEELSAEQRTKLQGEYTELVNKYFVTK